VTLRRLSGTIALALLAVLLVGAPARGAELATELTIRPVGEVVVGDRGVVAVQLATAGGEPLADEPVELSLDGTYLRRMRTNARGVATFTLPSLDAGEHAVTAVFPGIIGALVPASAERAFVVVPYELTIETVPPLPGMAFRLDDQRFAADTDGIARIAVSRAGEHTLAALDDDYRDGTVTAEFSRWNTELFWPEITITIPRESPLQAGFDVYRPVSQAFVDLDGDPVPEGRVTSIELRSSIGAVVTYPDGRTRDYKVSRSVRRPGGLESVPVMYNIDAVVVDGANVVNSGQQRFYIESDEPWQIRLLLYSIRVRPGDALFGFQTGRTVELLFPNGTTERHETDDAGWITVHGLARGIYRLSVIDPPGWAPVMPVALSRDQEVQLRVISWLDLAIVAVVGGGMVFGLLHAGRPHLLPGLARGAGRRIAGVRALTGNRSSSGGVA
jgi:hypothetical protein